MTRITQRIARIAVACVMLSALAAAPAVSATSGSPQRDSASGIASGKRMHKPYTVTAEEPVHCGSPANLASDPEEGGQLSANSGSGWDAKKNVKSGVTSDPEEGGQVTARSTGAPQISEMSVVKHADSASTKQMEGGAAGDTCPPSSH